MAITVNDLKLIESENMSNAADGGGAFTNNVIIDGASNNLFDDVTQQDRVYGKVNERKVFAAVRTQNKDKLMSAMAYVSKLPKDEKINVNLARSNLWFDNRSNSVYKTAPQDEILEQLMRLDNYIFFLYADQKYFFLQGKSMNCVVIGNNAQGQKTLQVSGIDGFIQQSYEYGINGLRKIFANKFIIKNGTNSESISVKDIQVMSYVDASEQSETYPYWTSDYEGDDTSYPPMKRYHFILHLAFPLKHSYVGANLTDTSTWMSADSKLYTVKTVQDEKFYPAKKITAQANANATEIAIASNTNQVIPVIDGISLDSEVLGIDTAKFNADGNYNAFSPRDVIAILNDKETTGTYSNGQTVTLTRQNLAKVTVRDSAGNLIDTAKFSANLTAGTVQFVDVSGLSQPLKITDRIEDLGLVTHATGTTLTLHKPLKNTYPIEGTIVSNCCLFGTLYASVSKPFDQQTWTNVWSDAVIGSTVTANFDFVNYPIVVNNLNAVTDRWAIIFTSSTVFNLVSEQFGQIVTGHNISSNLEPLNPATGQPYFTLPTLGLGGGWSAGNVIRFNTFAAAAPFWVLQSISQGEATDPDFNFAIEIRGDIDAA